MRDRMKDTLKGLGIRFIFAVFILAIVVIMFKATDSEKRAKEEVREETVLFCHSHGLYGSESNHYRYFECHDEEGKVFRYVKPKYREKNASLSKNKENG